MYVLVLLAVIVTPDGPLAITRPYMEYYKTEADCKKLGVRHVKEFMAGFEKEPMLLAGKCVQVTEIEGDPA